jgi:GTPase SAR1 family protein
MLLGEIGVGKTSLASQLAFGRLKSPDYKATLGVDIYRHTIAFQEPVGAEGERECSLVIWDVDGDLGDSIMGHTYMRGSSGALIIADLTRPSTFESMLTLAREFEASFPGRPVACVANKIDLVPDARPAEPAPLRGMGIPLTRTSAVTGEHVEEAFRSIARLVILRDL